MSPIKVLKERYTVVRELGRGAFGITYLASDRETDRLCAVKCLVLKQADCWKTIELLERESKILAHLV